MNLQFLIHIIILFLGIITSIIFAFLLSKNKTMPGSKLGILLVSGCIVWMAGKVLEFLSTGLKIKLFWSKIGYIGIVVIPVAYLLIILQNTGHEKWITLKKSILFSIIPALTLFFVFTNEFHSLFWRSVTLGEKDSLIFLVYEYGIWFWLWAAYLYILIMFSYFILIQMYDVMTHDRSYRKATRKEVALEELKRCAGTQFDPNLVKIFIQVLN